MQALYPHLSDPRCRLTIAPDDSDFLDSDAETTPHPHHHMLQSDVLQDLNASASRANPNQAETAPESLWPAHPLIRIHRRLWFSWFEGDLPSEHHLNRHNGLDAARKNFDHDEINKYVDPTETNPKRLHWFNIDHDLVYLRFWFDWGPLNVGMFYRFCLHVHHMLTDPDMHDATLVLYTTQHPARKANAALLVTLYAMIIGKVTPADAFYPIAELEFKPFRDAGYGRADYNLSIHDILYGVHRAINERLLDLTTFNLDEYEEYEQVSSGDWNWITPNFIAFASPNDPSYVDALRAGEGRLSASYSFRPPAQNTLFGRTIRYFKDRGVKLVVRLNNPLYDREAFLNAGIDHTDMYFDDGSNPTDDILAEFIAKADNVISQHGVVAVHCKAGLGRTGVLIGAYLIWKHGFSAGEAIGFMRFMRPGCVVGPQQHFMYQNFVEWIKWGVRDHAMKQAKQLIDDERAKMQAAQHAAVSAAKAKAKAAAAAAAAAAVSTSPVVAPRAVKRRAAGSDAAKGADDDSLDAQVQPHHETADQSLDDDADDSQPHKHSRKNAFAQEQSDDEDAQRPRQKQKSDVDVSAVYADVDGVAPATPKAQRGGAHALAALAAAGVKPAPCVGQPRKSPSPSRKRAAIQAPATVARLELTSRRYPVATRSFNQHVLLSSTSVHLDSTASGCSGGSGGGGGGGGGGASSLTVNNETGASEDADSNSGWMWHDDKTHVDAADVGGAAQNASSRDGANAGVLVESRINVVAGSTTPRASPKAAMVNLTPSPVARMRGFDRTRSNTISTATVTTPIRGSSGRDASVSPSAKPEVLRASPNIRDRYGLRDSSKSPPPQLPSLSSARGAVSRHGSAVKPSPSVVAKMSDAEVLGVIDCIPQQAHGGSSRKPSASSKPAVVKVRDAEIKVGTVDENSLSLANNAANNMVHRARLTVLQGAKVLHSARCRPTPNASSASVAGGGGGGARTVGVRKAGPTTRATTGGVVGSRSVSARLAATAGVVRTAGAQKSVSELRTRTTTSSSSTTTSATMRTVSSGSNSSTTATVTSRPASRLTAPTAASAARAAAVANAKRTATTLTSHAKTNGTNTRKVSTALQRGTAPRRRRSSTGEAGLDVAV